MSAIGPTGSFSSKLELLKRKTPARIGCGRAGARPRTETLLGFLADHARARDAVWSELSEKFLAEARDRGIFVVQSEIGNRSDYLRDPPAGRRLSPAALSGLSGALTKPVDLQVVICDGLSARAVEANVFRILPILVEGVTAKGRSVGRTVLVRYGRVAVGDVIGHAAGARTVIVLIGERPGLKTTDSVGAYVTYEPGEGSVNSDRTCVSNIHSGGFNPAEAGAHLVGVCERVLSAKASGVKLRLD